MKSLLVLTTLYPNSINVRHGIFIETRLKKLIESGECEAVVVAPVPWFPLPGKIFGRYAEYHKVPKKEVLNGITVHHPRYLVIPKIGMCLTPLFLALSFWFTIRKQEKVYDLIDAHYVFPDGVAAAIVKRLVKHPLVISGRGTDLNLIPDDQVARKMIIWAVKQSDKLITVSAALKERAVSIGIKPEIVQVIRNGVDMGMFNANQQCFDSWFLKDGIHVISVGNLTELKGHDLVIKAVARLNNHMLTIVGSGEEEEHLNRLIDSLGMQHRIRIIRPVPQVELARIYASASILVLASSREGWPNVILEALACGTQVIATDVGGVREIVDNEVNGFLLPERSVAAIEEALKKQATEYQKPDYNYVKQFSWENVVYEQNRLYQQVTSQ